MTNRVALPVKIVLAAVFALSSVIVAPAAPVSAHCPGTSANPHKYAGAYQNVPSSDAIYAIIQWTNPTLCLVSGQDDWTLEGVTLCSYISGGACAGWVQTGWVRRETQGPTPKGFCEWKPNGGIAQQYHYAITLEQHTYWWNRDPNTYWYCMHGTDPKYALQLNFSSGTYINAQGETNSNHSTIGRSPYPNAILFWQMQYRALPGYWYFTDLYDFLPYEWPYWVVEPTPGQMKNGTHSH